MMLHRSVSVCTILRTVRRSVRTRIRTSLFSFSSYSNYWHPARINLLRWCSNSSSSLPLKIATDSIPVYVYTHDCEPQSRKQLIRLAESGLAVGYVAAMPDVHLGKGATVGSVFASRDYVIPNAVGVDIGCGMAAVPMLNLKRSHLYKNSKGNDSTLRHIQRLLKERIPTGFNAHASPLRTAHSEIMRISKESPPSPWLELQLQSKGNIKRRGNAGIRALRQLGTLGGGNHFIEVLYDESDNVWLMLHSGSRYIGNHTASHYHKLAVQKKEQYRIGSRHSKHLRHDKIPADLGYLPIKSEDGRNYFTDMTWCQMYAASNRAHMLNIMRDVMLEVTGAKTDNKRAINVHHNYCQRENVTYVDPSTGTTVSETLFITRKGATSARKGQYGIIPGSMATGSYIVQGKGETKSWCSCSHGAGRRMSRTEAKKRISHSQFVQSLGDVVCDRDPKLRDEAPAAYKDLSTVMQNQTDLVSVVHRLKPLVNVKGF